MDFYGEVMTELIVALGAALFLGNAVALMRRRADAAKAAARGRQTVARSRPGSPVRGKRRTGAESSGELPQAPIARSIAYLVVGLVMLVWGLATLLS
ncbi:MAG TPA: hypothetical protein VF441_03805 [Acidimicrobiia bacterium]